MKRLNFIALFALLSSAFAIDPQKRLVFGPIQFGDTEKEYLLHNQTILATVNRRNPPRMNATDAWNHFVISGGKVPPKLGDKFKNLEINWSGGTPLSKFTVQSRQCVLAAYQAEIQEAWEAFRDIATAKFGKPIQSSPFPQPDVTSKVAFASTDKWKFGSLDIELGIQSFSIGAAGPKYHVQLIATDPEWEKVAQASLGPKSVLLPQGGTPQNFQNKRWDGVERERFGTQSAQDEITGWGVVFPPGASARYDAKTKQLFVTNTAQQVALLEKIIEKWNKWNVPGR